ncbi:MAG TPA: hypothetical protein PLN21_20295 [Gemmatales bacterium]|nr:hypothetical protein [Gemmatales bacterium]
MRSMILIIGLTMLPAAYGQTPPPFPSFPSPPANTGSQPPLDLTIKPMATPPSTVQTPALQQTAGYKDLVKPGDQVRTLRGTYIRSGPAEQAYPCGVIEGGTSVTLLELPTPGSEYSPIAAPDNCYSLIPITAIHHSWAVWVDLKKLIGQPQKVLTPTETLIYGESPTGEYLSSGYLFPKGSMITIVDEKRIKVKGKEAMYCIVRTGGKEKRFVRTADLEGVAAAAQAAQQTMPQNNGPLYGDNRAQQRHWQDTAPAQQSVLESEQLPPYLANQVQQAEQAYRTALHYGAWEDARQRYMHLLESEVLSVRILAKNRLEFISDWQRNPPVVTTAMSPQQGAGLSPALNHEPWIPGSLVVARPVATTPTAPVNIPAPVKDLVVKPNQPAVPASNPSFTVPTYPGTPAPQQQPIKQQAPPVNTTVQPQGQPVSRPAVATTPPVNTSPPPASAAAPTAAAPQRVKVVGKLNRAVQYTGPNPLYYLTNSQGFLTYYVRGTPSPNMRINDYLGRNIEVEGTAVQAVIDGQKKPQINVDKARLLQ